LYDTVHAVRQARARRTTRPARQKQTYLLAGLCICAHCRDSLRVQSQLRGAYYRCTAVERQREGGCAAVQRAVPACVLDAQMAEIMEHFKLAPDWRQRIMAAAVHDAERAAVEVERAQITRRLEKIRKLTIAEIMTEAEYQREKAELTDRLARLTLPADVEVEKAWELLDSLQTVWGHAATSVEERAAICRQLFSGVVVDLDGKAITEIHLREEFAPLFAALPAQVYTNGGTDGDPIREFDTHLTQEPAAGAPVFPTHFPLWLVPSTAPAAAKSRRPRVDPALWTEIAARARCESLRELGVAYGVSYETVRRILKRVAQSVGQDPAA
jgi:hypothetical protein